jgi:hypothetical protein
MGRVSGVGMWRLERSGETPGLYAGERSETQAPHNAPGRL